jgi:flagellar hook assembly protein FlgD
VIGAEEKEKNLVHKKGFDINIYPNPSKHSTTISYQIQRSEKIECKIYDVVGREVRTLVSSCQAVGSYNLVWDGKDDQGFDVKSGVYLVRLITEQEKTQAKLVLLK